MTISEALAKVNELKPNVFGQVEKIGWLSTCEWNIKREIIDTHEGYETVDYTGYDENTQPDTRMIVSAPYDELYIRWLEAQIDYANGEIGKYNNSMSLYNEAVSSFRNYYNRVHKPLQKNSMKFF